MRNYVNIIYIPGSCGNFFARCLNLLGNFYCFVNSHSTREEILNQSIEEKFKLLSYENVLKNISNDFSVIPSPDWWHTKHEYNDLIRKFYNHSGIEHVDTPENSTIVLDTHVNYYYNDVISQQSLMLGNDDKLYNFYIDPGQDTELVLLNFQYKLPNNLSFYNHELGLFCRKVVNDQNFIPISLEKIINSSSDCIKEIQKISQKVNHILTELEIDYITKLYNQWILTVITKDKINLFKKQYNISKN